MSLILTILNKPNPGQEISSAFRSEGTIGRATTNGWVLIDPDRSISNMHAKIDHNNGEYFITDTSTNGVFINKSAAPLGKGNRTKLSHNDKLKIGDYVISVTIQAEESLPLGNPDSSPFNQFIDAKPVSADTPVIPPENIGRIDDTSSLDINGHNPLDPLAMLNNSAPAMPPSSAPGLGSIDDLGIGSIDPLFPFDDNSPFSNQTSNHHFSAGTRGDNSSAMQQQFEPPPSSPLPGANSSAMIPDDWSLGATPADKKAAPIPSTGPGHSSIPPQPNRNAAANAASNGVFNNQSTQQYHAPSGAPPAATNSTIQNLLSGMGLEHLNLSTQEAATLAQNVGQFTRTTADGLIAALRARASIKSEFRMSMTIIQARENNPLKFSPSGNDALNHMFSPSNSSYMPAVQAVSESFNDMEAHMIAVMAGMQSALHTVLQRFDPATLELEFLSRAKAKGFSLSSKKAKNWDIYNEHYKEIIASVEDDFQTLFGDEFSRAYEEQVARLKASKNTR